MAIKSSFNARLLLLCVRCSVTEKYRFLYRESIHASRDLRDILLSRPCVREAARVHTNSFSLFVSYAPARKMKRFETEPQSPRVRIYHAIYI